jgi:hypothetical protein
MIHGFFASDTFISAMEASMLNDVSVMAIIVALVLVVEHYFPWQLVLRGGDLPRPVAYMLGVAAMVVPVLVLLAGWGMWRAVWAVITAVVVGGTTVLICYLIDWILRARIRLQEQSEREHLLREQVINDPDQTAR